MSKSYDDKQASIGGNDGDLGTKRDQLAEAKESLADDQEFLAKLLVMCTDKAKQYDSRKLLRANEEAAISQAIAVLNSDAAFGAFGKVDATKSGATSLLQLSRRNAGSAQAAVRLQAQELLQAVAS